jgi:O-antigen ligase
VRSPKQRGLAIAAVVFVVAVAGYVIFSKANTTRLESSEKDARATTHETVWNMLKSRTPAELIVGSGIGSVWPWYLTETETADIWQSGKYMTRTPFGLVLYHPHSAILLLVVELGLAGFLLLGKIGWTCWNSLREAARTGSDVMFAASVAVSLFSIGFDFFLFRRPTRDAVWWIMFFGMLALLAQTRRDRTRFEERTLWTAEAAPLSR